MTSPDTDELLLRASQGEDSARGQLLNRHWERLRRMISIRLRQTTPRPMQRVSCPASAAPAGANRANASIPSDNSLGYYRPPLPGL